MSTRSSSSRLVSRVWQSVRTHSGATTVLYLGVVLVIAGFATVAVGWGKVAALHVVGLQLPYIASACFVGAALVICGTGAVLAAVRWKDASVRVDQMRELTATLHEVRELLVAESAQRGDDDARGSTKAQR
jgi:hypothetical protein